MNDRKLRILLAEAYPGEIATVLRALYPEDQHHLELTQVSSISNLMASIDLTHPEIIFLDISLANSEPLDQVRRVHRSAPSTPLIVLADPKDKLRAAQSLSQGAHDYLLKGFVDPHALERVLRSALGQNTVAGLADLLRDPLTGLYIREGFLTLGDRAMETTRAREGTLVLVCLRIANLATLRQEHGLSAEEAAVKDVSKLMQSSFRRTDIVSRLGASQFAALAVDAAEPSAPVLCQRLQKRVAMLNLDAGPWGPLEIRMSARFWSAKVVLTFTQLLDSVEAALRQSSDVPGEEVVSHGTVNTLQES